jgi:hypothetical protein
MYTKKERMHNIILQEEEVSILAMDTEDKDKDELWVEDKEKNLLQLRASRTFREGLLEPFHNLQLLQFLRACHRGLPFAAS